MAACRPQQAFRPRYLRRSAKTGRSRNLSAETEPPRACGSDRARDPHATRRGARGTAARRTRPQRDRDRFARRRRRATGDREWMRAFRRNPGQSENHGWRWRQHARRCCPRPLSRITATRRRLLGMTAGATALLGSGSPAVPGSRCRAPLCKDIERFIHSAIGLPGRARGQHPVSSSRTLAPREQIDPDHRSRAIAKP